MKRKLSVFGCLFFLVTCLYANPSPLPSLEGAANQLISKLQQNKSQLKTNPALINGFVKTIVLPLVAQEPMARSVISRALWDRASAAQHAAFVAQFRNLVIRTYASAFANYNNETVKFKPLRPGQLNQNYVTVDSTVVRPGGQPPIPVTYSLTLTNGKWLVTDFSVEGVSMVNSFKTQIASLDASKGLAGITAMLQKHNNK